MQHPYTTRSFSLIPLIHGTYLNTPSHLGPHAPVMIDLYVDAPNVVGVDLEGRECCICRDGQKCYFMWAHVPTVVAVDIVVKGTHLTSGGRSKTKWLG